MSTRDKQPPVDAGGENRSEPAGKSAAGPEGPRGEVWVWFTAMGLAVGLFLVAFLFGLVTYRGLAYFWPAPVVQIELSEESGDDFFGSRTFAGVLAKTQERADRVVSDDAEETGLEDIGDAIAAAADTFTEIQLFLGNRDAYGLSFRYFREDDVVETSYPRDIIRAERREWGDGIFFPRRILYGDGTELERDDLAFEAELDRLVTEARARRAEIHRIDRRQIGRINLEMERIRRELRYFHRQAELTEAQQAEVARLSAREADLQEEFAVHESAANELRRLNSENHFVYERPTGDEDRLAIGDLYRFYYPNRLNLLQRFQVFAIHGWEFVTSYPREANMEGGIFPAIFGTFVMTLIMSVAVMPFGVMAAIYLREYARQGPLVRSVRIAINNLAGVPSIVYGVFGLGFFVYLVGGGIDQLFFPRATEMNVPTFGTGGILWAGLTLALLNVPVVIVATEETLAAVSRGVREGSLACGASKWQTIRFLVLPAALPGILTGLILAMARGAGEVAPLMLVGVVAFAPNLPVDSTFPFIHLERKFMHLGFHIYDVGFQSPDSEAAIPTVFATTLILIALILVLNLAAILIRNHLKKKHAATVF